MSTTAQDAIIHDQESAVGYDEQARQTKWFGADAVFGLTYEFVQPGEVLLDIGIGSGLSSVLFHKAGLKIYGLDASDEILKVCEAKGFVADLRQHDIRDTPYPYPDQFFQHIISVAVLNALPDLHPVVVEVGRMLKPQGIFAFTVENQKPGDADRYLINKIDVDEQPKPEDAVILFRCRPAEISDLLTKQGFTLRKTFEFAAFEYPAEQRNIFFKAYIAQKR